MYLFPTGFFNGTLHMYIAFYLDRWGSRDETLRRGVLSRMPMGAGPRAVTEAGRRAVTNKAPAGDVECRLQGCLEFLAEWRYPQQERHVIPRQGGSR